MHAYATIPHGQADMPQHHNMPLFLLDCLLSSLTAAVCLSV